MERPDDDTPFFIHSRIPPRMVLDWEALEEELYLPVLEDASSNHGGISPHITQEFDTDVDSEEEEEETEEAFRRRADVEAQRLRTGGGAGGQSPRQRAVSRVFIPPAPRYERINDLLEAVRNQNLPRLRLLLRQKPNRTDLIETFGEAIQVGNLPIIQLLVQAGIYNEPNTLTYELRSAVERNDRNMIRYLANLPNVNLNAGLVEAASLNNLEVVQYLISLGADDYRRALDHAATWTQKDVIVYLLRRYQNQLEIKDIFGAYIIVTRATRSPDVELLALLLQEIKQRVIKRTSGVRDEVYQDVVQSILEVTPPEYTNIVFEIFNE